MGFFDFFKKKKTNGRLKDLPPVMRQAYSVLFPKGQTDQERQLDELCDHYGSKYQRDDIYSNLVFILSGYLITGTSDTKESAVSKVLQRQVNKMSKADVEYLYNFALSNHPKLSPLVTVQSVMDKMSHDGCDSDTIPGGKGYFGYSQDNPIPVHGITGIYEYLGNLRDKNGNKVSYERIGTVQSFISDNPIDVYAITSPSISRPINLFVSAYHKRNSKLSPSDFILVDQDNIIISNGGTKYGIGQVCEPGGLPKPKLTAINYFGVIDSKMLPNFPSDIIEAESLNRRGFIKANAGETESAISLLNEAIAKGSVNAINSLFAVLHSAERFKEAHDALAATLKAGHRSAALYYNLAIIYSGYDKRYPMKPNKTVVVSCLRKALELPDDGLEEYRPSIQNKCRDLLNNIKPEGSQPKSHSDDVKPVREEQSTAKPSQENSACNKNIPANIQDILGAASLGLMGAQTGNHRAEQKNLFNMFNLVQESCSQILQIPEDQYNLVGSAFSLLLSYPQVQANEDVARAIADYAFFCISKAIDKTPNNEVLHTKRVSILAETRNYFYFTIANAMELPDYNPMDFFASMPLIVRTNSYLYAMVKYDLSFMSNKHYDGQIGELINLAQNSMSNNTLEDGHKYIEKVMVYLTNTFMKY